MTLTAADVAQIMRVIEQSTFDELSLEMDGVKLLLRRTGAAGEFAQSVTTPSDSGDAATAAAQTKGETAPSTLAALPGTELGDITSPMLGTFYRCPKPGSAPYVEIGSRVDVDSVIAIIEVMKLMNTVRAGVRGVITEILPADESLVEFGDVLMRVRADA